MRHHINCRRCLPLLLGFFLLPLSSRAQTSSPITLSPEQVVPILAQGSPTYLVDEQSLAGDPQAGNGGQPQTIFEAGYDDFYLPAELILDLGTEHKLTAMWYFDMFGKDSIQLYTGKPGQWQSQPGIYTNSFRSWKSINLSDTTRFIKLVFKSNQAQVAELVAYGQDLGTGSTSPPAPSAPHTTPRMGKFIGLNGFIDDPLDVLAQAGGTLREYHSWEWSDNYEDTSYTGYPPEKLAFEPAWVTSWDFDTYYRDLKNRGVTVAPVIQGTPPYFRGDKNPQMKPVPPRESASSPHSYRAHASFLYQYAARYGRSLKADSLLAVRDDQAARSGLNYLRYLENWNEPDKWWDGRISHFTPFEFAAMCSADYDGHEGALGPLAGMKTADSTMQFVMGGLAGLRLDYLIGMKLWSDYHRSSGFPADVLNFHHYSHNGGPNEAQTQGIPPEADSLKQKLQKLVAYRDQHLPGKAIWITEFGYDTNPETPQSAQPIGPYDPQEVQAQWLVRSYLEMAASGVDRALMYMSRDVYHPASRKYTSSGLTREKWNDHAPKTSFFYVAAFRHLLKNYRFEKELPSGQAQVNLYRFRHVAGDSVVYAVWSTTAQARTLAQFPVAVTGQDSVKLLQLQDQSPLPTDSLLPRHNDSLRVPVSEKPLFLKTVAQDSQAPVSIPHQKVWAYLDEQGRAVLKPEAVDSASHDNQRLVERSLLRDTFTCADLPAGQASTALSNQLRVADHYQADTAAFTLILADTLPPRARAQVQEVSLDSNGQAQLSAAMVNDSSWDNCAALARLQLSDSLFHCHQVDLQGQQEIVSDGSWTESHWVNQSGAGGYPWQAPDTLPADNSFQQSVNLGQPYSYHRVDSIPGTRLIETGNYLRYFRKTFTLEHYPVAALRSWHIADDNLAIFINGHLLSFENDQVHPGFGDALHGFEVSASGQVKDSLQGSTPMGYFHALPLSEIFRPGENQITIAAHNYNNPGAFSFKLELFQNALETQLIAEDAQGLRDSTAVTVVLNGPDSLSCPQQGKRGRRPKENQASEMQVFPNPASQVLQVRLPATQRQSAELQLFAPNGQLLQRRAVEGQRQHQLDIAPLPPGVYLLKLSGIEEPHQQSFVKR